MVELSILLDPPLPHKKKYTLVVIIQPANPQNILSLSIYTLTRERLPWIFDGVK
jgi:hypothetical protein